MSLAIFAALVAAIAVVASMTVLGAVCVMYYSSQGEEEGAEPVAADPWEALSMSPPSLAPQPRPPPLHEGLAQRQPPRVSFFDDEDSSIAGFDPARSGLPPAFGSPEWTEEEGATEIFTTLPPISEQSSEFAFADPSTGNHDPSSFDELPTRVAVNLKG